MTIRRSYPMGGVPGTNTSLLQCLIGFRKRVQSADPAGGDSNITDAQLSKGSAILEYGFVTQLDPARLALCSYSRKVLWMQGSVCGYPLRGTPPEHWSPLQSQQKPAQGMVLQPVPRGLQANLRTCSSSSSSSSEQGRPRHQAALVLPPSVTAAGTHGVRRALHACLPSLDA